MWDYIIIVSQYYISLMLFVGRIDGFTSGTKIPYFVLDLCSDGCLISINRMQFFKVM